MTSERGEGVLAQNHRFLTGDIIVTDKKTIVLIEQLDFITYAAYCLFFKKSVQSAFFVNTGSLFGKFRTVLEKKYPGFFGDLHQVYHSDFPGSWYNQKEQTGLFVNERLFQRYQNNIFVSSAIKFGKNSCYELAVRKELYSRYTFNRVKTCIFLKRLSEVYDSIIFLPSDGEKIVELLAEDLQPIHNYSSPKYYLHLLNFAALAKVVISAIAFPFILCYLAVTFLVKGVSFDKPEKKQFNYGIDTFSDGIPWRVPYNSFFIYNKSDFHPSKVLHVVRDRLADIRTLEKFNKYHFPCTTWNAQKTPFHFFISQIIVDLVLKQMKQFFMSIFTCNKNPVFFFPSLAVVKMIIEYRIFYCYYDLKVFIARDDYSSLHVVRTLVAHENNAHSVGFMHGDYTLAGIETSVDLLFDKYGIFGTYYLQRHKQGLAFSNPKVIGAGIYGLDKTHALAQKGYIPEKYRDIKKTYKILLIVGGPYNLHETDSCFTKDLMIKFYEDILSLTDEYKDYYRVIKPAGDDRLDEDLKRIASRHERVVVDKSLWTYKIILISDLTICYASCTVGLESLMAGKKVIFYDLYGYQNHAYKDYSPLLVAQTAKALKSNLKSIISDGKYLDPDTLHSIRKVHGLRYDGQIVHRLRQLCRDLIKMSR